MDRKLVWTEKASSDIEAIVRYIARRLEQFSANCAKGVGESSFIVAGKIVYTIRADDIIIGRVWPAAMGEADLETPL
jgi:plasmid stabilization system protein ParE